MYHSNDQFFCISQEMGNRDRVKVVYLSQGSIKKANKASISWLLEARFPVSVVWPDVTNLGKAYCSWELHVHATVAIPPTPPLPAPSCPPTTTNWLVPIDWSYTKSKQINKYVETEVAQI